MHTHVRTRSQKYKVHMRARTRTHIPYANAHARTHTHAHLRKHARGRARMHEGNRGRPRPVPHIMYVCSIISYTKDTACVFRSSTRSWMRSSGGRMRKTVNVASFRDPCPQRGAVRPGGERRHGELRGRAPQGWQANVGLGCNICT